MAKIDNWNGGCHDKRITVQRVDWRMVANSFAYIVQKCARLDLDPNAGTYKNKKGTRFENLYELMDLCDSVNKTIHEENTTKGKSI